MLAQAFTCVAALLAALVAILAASPFAAPAVMVLAIIFGRLDTPDWIVTDCMPHQPLIACLISH